MEKKPPVVEVRSGVQRGQLSFLEFVSDIANDAQFNVRLYVMFALCTKPLKLKLTRLPYRVMTSEDRVGAQ